MEDPSQQCIGWIYKLFGECATTQQHAWSIVLGYASIFAWLNAQIPQIIENFKLGSADSLSLPFLINWLLGDFSNLIGCYLTNQLPFQKYLAIYFCLADIVLFGQWIYYSRQQSRRKELPGILIATLPEISDTTSHQTVEVGSKRSRPATITGASLRGAAYPLDDDGVDADLEQGEHSETVSPLLQQRTRPRRATTTEELAHRRSTSIVLFGLLFLTLRSTMPAGSVHQQQQRTASSSGAGVMLMVAGRVLKRQDDGGLDATLIPPLSLDEPAPMDPAVHLGRIFAWVCTIFYLSSRMPQVWKNYRRKSVQGLSILMFFWAAMGNFTYTLSILNSPDAVKPDTSAQYLKEAVPYILGSSGTLLFDVSIFVQWLYYTKLRRRHHRHHHHGHRRRRSSRHLSRQSRAQSRPDTVCMSHPSSHIGTPRAPPGGYNMLVDQEDDEDFLNAHHEDSPANASSSVI